MRLRSWPLRIERTGLCSCERLASRGRRLPNVWRPLPRVLQRPSPERAIVCNGSIAPLRFRNPRTFDRLSVWPGSQFFSGRFVDFFAAATTTSYVCSTLTPVIPDSSFFANERRELAATVSSRLSRTAVPRRDRPLGQWAVICMPKELAVPARTGHRPVLGDSPVIRQRLAPESRVTSRQLRLSAGSSVHPQVRSRQAVQGTVEYAY